MNTPARRLFSTRLPGLGLAALLASCTSLKPEGSSDGHVSVPNRWQSGGSRSSSAPKLDTAGLARWWQRFNDPVLNELITEALRASPDVRTALARIEESRARTGVERSTLFPTISTGLSGQGARTDNRSTGIRNSENYSASANLNWELDLFGKLRQNVRASYADLAQTTENFYAAQVSLAADVASAYVTLRAAEAQYTVIEQSLGTRNETVDLTKWREQSGEASALETQQAITILEQARASLPSLKQTIAQTRNQLALLAGKPPGAFDSILGRGRRTPPQPPAMLAIGIPADTLRQRPDVRAAEFAIEAAMARTKSAKAERYPTLGLNGSLGLESLTTGTFFSPQTAAASIAGNLAAPIFNAGRIRESINIQSAQEKQALIAYESTVLQALSDVENALIAIRQTNERLELLGRATAAASQAATLASQQYEAGQSDILTVLDSQRTLLSLQEQQAITTGNRASAHIQLYRALGGGWSSRS